MRIHVTAVAGTGMGSLAGLLVELGHTVTGSDINFYPPMGPALKDWGIRLFQSFSAEHVDAQPDGLPRADVVVVGNVCRKDNPEALAADALGIERLHIADALARYALPNTSPLVVAGTHGKTTTSSLCAHLLDRMGFEPGFLIGGIPESLGRGFRKAGPRRLRLGEGSSIERKTPFVLEGDEYDTAYWEKTAKFLHYRAEVAIVTSVEHDHVDIYPTYEAYRSAFERFIKNLPANGLLIAYAGDPEVVALSRTAPCEVAYYALQGEATHGAAPHWLAAPATESEEGITFDLFAGGVLAGRYVSPLAGQHNLKNVLAALAAAAHGFGAPLRGLAEPLASFRGVKRRQELKGSPRNIRIYDDFAHHPTAVIETLRALRAKHRDGKLIAVFEPRSATACRRIHQTAYESAFDPADVILLAPNGRPDLPREEQLDVDALALAIRERGKTAESRVGVEDIVSRLVEISSPGDTILVLSNGSFGGIFEKLESALRG